MVNTARPLDRQGQMIALRLQKLADFPMQLLYDNAPMVGSYSQVGPFRKLTALEPLGSLVTL